MSEETGQQKGDGDAQAKKNEVNEKKMDGGNHVRMLPSEMHALGRSHRILLRAVGRMGKDRECGLESVGRRDANLQAVSA